MNARVIAALILGGSVFAVAAFGAALQGSDKKTTEGLPAAQPRANPKPRNLKVLPKEISGDDVDKLMHQYEQYLGVTCGYCHKFDENPVKETARFMISMTSDINNKYLSQLGDRRYAVPITCGNCHRGQVQPPSFELKSHP